PLTKPPNLMTASVPELLAHLKAPDRWTRQFAKRALADRDSKEIAPAAEEWRKNAIPTEHALKEALGVLQSHEMVNEQLLLQVALSSDPGARAYAASAIGRWAD